MEGLRLPLRPPAQALEAKAVIHGVQSRSRGAGGGGAGGSSGRTQPQVVVRGPRERQEARCAWPRGAREASMPTRMRPPRYRTVTHG
jgi:hypothetical protein